VLRKVDTWSVARMAFCLNLCLALVVVVAGMILWLGADGQGLIDKLEQTIRTNLQLETFEIHGNVLFRSVLLCAVLAAALFTGLAVIGALLFNLLSDLVGGIQVWVLEEVVGDTPVYDQEEPPTGEQAILPFSGEIEFEAAGGGSGTDATNGNGHVETDAPEPAGLPRA
jgi:transmembrane protein DUF3566